MSDLDVIRWIEWLAVRALIGFGIVALVPVFVWANFTVLGWWAS